MTCDWKALGELMALNANFSACGATAPKSRYAISVVSNYCKLIK